MRRIAPILFFTLCFCALGGSAQLKSANKMYSQLKYNRAIPYFLKVVNGKKDDGKTEATWKLAECYRLTNHPEEASGWFKKAIKNNNIPNEVYLHYGSVLRSLGRYDDAKLNFGTYLKNNPGNIIGLKYLEYCEEIEDWKDLEPSAQIENDSLLNSRFSDFSPVHYNKGLIIISDRDYDMLENNNNYLWTGNGYLDLYFQGSKTELPRKMSKDFNQTYHDGPVCLANKDTVIFITRTLKTKLKRKDTVQTHYTGIYIAQLNKEKITFKPFEHNNLTYSVAHPAVSADGKQMIFSADMPGGYGKSDLYFSELVNGEWTKPKNMGEQINSFGNEYFAYLKNDSTLYFSSDGHMGYGGLDIYVSKYKNGEWQTPKNLMAPINSSYDDFGIILYEDFKSGYFSSNRPGGKGLDDIYFFKDFREVQ